MNLNKKIEERHEILSSMEQELTKNYVAAQLLKQNDSVEVLSVLLENLAVDGLNSSGEFFFLPNQEDDEIQFFVNLITIAEELEDENLNELLGTLATINTFVTTGAFSVDPASKTLVYKLTYPMPIDLNNDAVKDYADMSMGLALQIVRDYGYMLIEINEGKRSAESVLGSFVDLE